jgi:hypothetical protein
VADQTPDARVAVSGVDVPLLSVTVIVTAAVLPPEDAVNVGCSVVTT